MYRLCTRFEQVIHMVYKWHFDSNANPKLFLLSPLNFTYDLDLGIIRCPRRIP